MVYDEHQDRMDKMYYFRTARAPSTIVDVQRDMQGQIARYVRGGLAVLALAGAAYVGGDMWNRFQAPYRAQRIHNHVTTAGSMEFDYSQLCGTSKVSIVRQGDALQVTYTPKGVTSLGPLSAKKVEITDRFPYGDADWVEETGPTGDVTRTKGDDISSLVQGNYADVLAAAASKLK